MADLASARIVVTIPPKGWFGDYDRISAFALVKQLEQRFGSKFYELDTTPFAEGNAFKRDRSIEALRAYRPDLAISLNNAGYALLCSVPSGTGVANLFTEVLGIPLMLPWDHGLFQFPSLIPPRHPEAVAAAGSVLPPIRAVLDHPLIHHLPIDSGQVAEMQRIGMIGSSNIGLAPAAAYLPYLDYGRRHPNSPSKDGLTFVGNLYAGEFEKPEGMSPVEQACLEAVMAAKQAQPLANSWSLVMDALAGLDPDVRAQHRLDVDHAHFWQFTDDLIRRNCNMIGRTRTIEAVADKVGLYGEFASGASVEGLKRFPNVEYKGFVDFAEGLPAVYAQAEITLDVTNAAFIANCSSKPICCLAAGGFPLFDFKPDAVATLGREVEALMFRSAEELNRKIEYYLTHPKEKRQLATMLQRRVRERCDFANVLHDRAQQILGISSERGLFSRVLGLLGKSPAPAVPEPDERPGPTKVADHPSQPGPGAAVLVEYDLPRELDISPGWGGARVVGDKPLVIRTADQPWSYSACIAIGAGASCLSHRGRLWLAVTSRCEQGSFALSLMYGDALIDETVVRAAPEMQTTYILIESPRGLDGFMIRNEHDTSSLVQIDAISLLGEEPA